jgi:hypothetical protein
MACGPVHLQRPGLGPGLSGGAVPGADLRLEPPQLRIRRVDLAPRSAELACRPARASAPQLLSTCRGLQEGTALLGGARPRAPPCRSVCLSVCPVHAPGHPLSVCLSVCLSFCLSVWRTPPGAQGSHQTQARPAGAHCRSVCKKSLSVCLSVCPSRRPGQDPPVHSCAAPLSAPPRCLSVCPTRSGPPVRRRGCAPSVCLSDQVSYARLGTKGKSLRTCQQAPLWPTETPAHASAPPRVGRPASPRPAAPRPGRRPRPADPATF